MNAPARDARVTVIVVNYRTYAELAACLASLERTTPPVHIVVVDQQSNPRNAGEIVRRFPHATLIAQERNTGFAAGVNRGAREAASPYLLLLNPDATIEPDLCHWLPAWMDTHEDVGVAGPRVQNEDGSIQASARRFPDYTTAIAGRSSWLTRVLPGNRLSRRNLRGLDVRGGEPLDVDWVSGACMLIRRAAFVAVGGMDEGFFLYWEDADFCRRVSHAGWRVVYAPTVGAMHAGGRSSRQATDASLLAFHRSAFRLFWKHASTLERAFAPLVFLALRARLAFVRRRARAKS